MMEMLMLFIYIFIYTHTHRSHTFIDKFFLRFSILISVIFNVLSIAIQMGLKYLQQQQKICVYCILSIFKLKVCVCKYKH